jgi:hypothetical protein
MLSVFHPPSPSSWCRLGTAEGATRASSFVATCDACRFEQTCATRAEAVKVAADHTAAHMTRMVSVEEVAASGPASNP